MKRVGKALCWTLLLVGWCGLIQVSSDALPTAKVQSLVLQGFSLEPVKGATVTVCSTIACTSAVTDKHGRSSTRVPAEPNTLLRVHVLFGGELVGSHELPVGQPPFGNFRTTDLMGMIAP